MTNLSINQINFKSTQQSGVVNNPFAQFQQPDLRKTMNPVNCNVSSNIQQPKQNIESKVDVKSNTPSQDTFDKKAKTQNAIKYSAIGAGVAAIAYSAFALIKYGKKSNSLLESIVEPVKVLVARIKPNGFKPKVSIEENNMKYLGDVSFHLNRLKTNQKKNYLNHLYSKTNFTEQGENDFLRYFGEYLER